MTHKSLIMKKQIILAIGLYLCSNSAVGQSVHEDANNPDTYKVKRSVPTIGITCVSPDQKKQPPQDIRQVPFGSVFTDHMFVMEWSEDHGWHNARIEPYKHFTFEPASLHLHYGSEIFEGLKAYKTIDGTNVLFRPRDHLSRFNESAKRMCMPEIDQEFVLQALKMLICQDQEWIPSLSGSSLYIRPAMIATESSLNLKQSNSFLFFIILSPVNFLYADGFNPTSILVSEFYTRSSIGGVGQAKTGGNYAASMLAQQEAKKQQCSQVLWLDSVERKYVEEVGSMNIFFVIDGTIVTPALTGTILPGITRKSVIALSKKMGFEVIERQVALEGVLKAIESGLCTEIFGTGTAAVLAPVGVLQYQGKKYVVNENKTGPITQQLFNALTSIQRGRTEDSFGWVEIVK